MRLQLEIYHKFLTQYLRSGGDLMDRWEYCILEKDQSESAFRINGQQLKGDTSLHELLTRLGNEGWELVSHTWLGRNYGLDRYILKRLKP